MFFSIETQLLKETKELCDVRETLVEDTDLDCFQNFVESFRQTMPDATVLFSSRLE
jgi:hypothetical protein